MNLSFAVLASSVFLIAAGAAFYLSPLTRKYSLKRKFFDRTDHRKVHGRVVTRLGGTAIYAGICLSFLVIFAAGLLRRELVALFAGSAVIFAAGVFDDARGIPAPVKLAAQLVACAVIILSGFRVVSLTVPFSATSINLPGALPIIIAAAWILLITNAVNFLDGLDGLAAGIVAIACVFIFWISVSMGRYENALPFLAVAGGCTGFLKHNFYPAKMFMGDGGSMTLGFCVACLSLFGALKAPAAFSLFIPLTILGVPVADTFLALMRRTKHRRLFTPDKRHLHHRIIQGRATHKHAVFILYSITTALGFFAFSFSPHLSPAARIIALISMVTVLSIAKRFPDFRC